MRKLLLTLLPLLVSQAILSQNRHTDSSATCIAYWGKNDLRTFRITKIKEKKLSNDSTSKNVVNYDVAVRVVDSTKDGYKLEWKQSNFRVDGQEAQVNAATSLLMSGVKFLYTTDDVGSFKELVNWKEVRDFYVNMMKVQLSAGKQDDEVKATMDRVVASLSTKESVEALMIREVQLLHTPYGVEYDRSGTDAQTELPNFLGGDPFPAVLNLSLQKLDLPADKATVVISQEVDKIKGRQALLSMMSKIAPKAPMAEMSEAIKQVQISDKTSYTFSMSSGWMSKVDYVRTVDLGGAYQVERYVIEERK